MGYIKVAAKGITWVSFFRIINRIVTIARLSLLGRLLTPAQFGYFGVATLVLAFLEVITETGINIFLIQGKKDIREYINSAWVISIFRGILLSCIIILATPFIVDFFNVNEAYYVLLLTAAIPFIRGFINPAIVTYQKELLFRNEFRLRTAIFFLDVVVSVLFAFYTRNAVSFVYGLIASAILEVILSFYLIPLRPKFIFEFRKMKQIIQKGWWVTVTVLFGYLADNGDNLTVGKLMGSASLGIYQVAYKLSTLTITEIANVVNQVIFPVYSKFSDDKKRLRRAFFRVTGISSFVGFVISLVLYIFAEQIITLFMGNQWLAAIPIVKILALYGFLRTVFDNFMPLFHAVQKQDYVAKMTFVRVMTLLLVIVPMVSLYGMIGAAYAMVLSVVAEIPITLFYGRKVL